MIRLAAGILFSLTFSLTSSANGLPDGPYVSVSATGSYQVEPEWVEIFLSLEQTESSGEAVREALNQSQKDLVETLEPHQDSIASIDVINSYFSKVEERNRQTGEVTFDGYAGHSRVSVLIHDLDRAEEIYYALSGLDIARLDRMEPGIEDYEALEENARKAALSEARRVAESLATERNARLGPVWGIVYDPLHQEAGRFERTGHHLRLIHRRSRALSDLSASMVDTEFTLPTHFAEIRVVSRVGVVYELIPNAQTED